MISYPIQRAKAVEMIGIVANYYGINNAFDLFDDDMIDYKLGQLANILEQNPTDRHGNLRCPFAFWFRLVEDELGIDPGESREVSEYRQFLSEGI